MRNSGFLRRLADAARDFIHDHIVVGCISAQEAAKTDDRVVFFGFSEGARGRGDFERAGNANDFDVVVFRARTNQPVVGASQQAIGDEFIKSRDHDPEAKASCIEFSGASLPPNLFFGRFLRASVSRW